MFAELTPIYDAENNQQLLNCQNEFDSYVTRQSANAKTYDIPFACEGVIDMSIFETQGRTPQCIKFIDGRIQYLLNVPKSLKELVIDNNQLDQLPDAPYLTILKCSGNRIVKAPHRKDFTTLVKLSIDNNKLTVLEDLPANLEWLSATHNPELSYVDLATPENCLYVDLRENEALKQVINVCQAGNKGFQLHTPAHTKIVYIDDGTMTQTMDGGKKQQHLDKELEQTIDTYYALKAEYERERIKKVREIAANTKYASLKEKRQALRKVQKKCIKCGKPGAGMRFWRDNDMLHAECAAQPKCNFHMSVSVGFYAGINYLLAVATDDMAEKRANIIRLKMDTLFNYITETASKTAFKKELEMYQGDEAMYNTYRDYMTLMISDPVKERLIKKKTAEMWKIMKEVRVMIEVYMKNGDKRMLREAVEKQINELHPEVAALRTLKHPVMQMDEHDDGTYYLVQNNYAYEAADYKLI